MCYTMLYLVWVIPHDQVGFCREIYGVYSPSMVKASPTLQQHPGYSHFDSLMIAVYMNVYEACPMFPLCN